jgi:RNA polymerase sigma factor (sigma-70 family)
MTGSRADFCELMRRVRDGSREALDELVHAYQHHILHAVRRKLNNRLRSKFDSLDFQQAVWASFFAHRSQIGNFTSAEQLIAFLASLARHKVIDEFRRRIVATKHNVNFERSLNRSSAHFLVATNQPTPSQVAMANEKLATLLKNQPDQYKQIVVLRQEGNSNKEIAKRLGVNEKTVRRVLEKLATKNLA